MNLVLKRISTVIAAGGAAVIVAACGSTHLPHPTHVASKIECGIQYHKWDKAGGLKKLHTAGTDIATMARQIESHQSKSVKANAKTVEDAITAAQSDLPPGCVTGLDTDVSRALGDAKVAVKDAAKQNTAGLQAAGNKLKDAKAALKQAAQDVRSYLKS